MIGNVGSTGVEGRAIVECPTCSARGIESTLDTATALMRERVSGTEVGVRWTGVRCPVCGDSFTIEAARDRD